MNPALPKEVSGCWGPGQHPSPNSPKGPLSLHIGQPWGFAMFPSSWGSPCWLSQEPTPPTEGQPFRSAVLQEQSVVSIWEEACCSSQSRGWLSPVPPAWFPAGPLRVDSGHHEGRCSFSKLGVGKLFFAKGQRVSILGLASHTVCSNYLTVLLSFKGSHREGR